MSASGHRSDYVILVTLGIILVLGVLVCLSWGWLRQGGNGAIPFRTTRSTGQDGAMACYLLYERLGYDVWPSDRPLLPRTLSACDVLVILDSLYALEDGELLALHDWVGKGGVLVYSRHPRFPASFTRQGRVQPRGNRDVRPGTTDLSVVTRVPEDASELPLARDVARVRFESDTEADLYDCGPFEDTAEGTPLFADSVAVRVVEHTLERGRVLVLADSSFLANARLGDADNSILAANIVAYAVARARGGRIAFDEYHLGYGSTRTGWTILGAGLWRTSLGWAVLCLLTAGGLFLFYRGRRFGTRYPPSRERRRTKLEYVHCVGATFKAAGAHGLTFDITYHWFRRHAAAAAGLPPSAPVDVLAAAMARRGEHGASHYEQILRSCEEALAEKRLGARRASTLLDRLASIEREVPDGHRTRN